jgi:uncharacterized protein DUF559
MGILQAEADEKINRLQRNDGEPIDLVVVRPCRPSPSGGRACPTPVEDEGVPPGQRDRARAMRGAPTAELRLWRLLRDRRLCGLKFRRQVPVGPYIVDFLCVGAKLIVEADGA